MSDEPILPTPPTPENQPEDLEIHTIPDKFYGTALKAKIADEKKLPPAQGLPEQKKSKLPIVIIVLVLLLGTGGGFAYFNRELLFPKAPAPIVVEAPKTPEPPPLPEAPTDLVATSTSPTTVSLTWKEASMNETGFRIERDNGSGTFASLTNLPPNSTSFLDTSVTHKTTYIYRVKTLNARGESDSSNEATASTRELPPLPPEQPKLPPAGLDTDSDGLTDLEEALFGTNARAPDADNDGFLDGNEVFHLYNPSGQAPARLLDLPIMKTVEAKVGWAMSLPSAWTINLDNQDGTKATIDTKRGETFVVTVEENPNAKTILDWYLESHPGVVVSQVLQYRSKGGYVGIIGADLLSTYIPWGSKVFVFTYELGNQPFINYRTTYSMMLNSLALKGIPVITQPISGTPLPFEPSATSGGVVAQPVPVEQATTSAQTMMGSSTKP